MFDKIKRSWNIIMEKDNKNKDTTLRTTASTVGTLAEPISMSGSIRLDIIDANNHVNIVCLGCGMIIANYDKRVIVIDIADIIGRVIIFHTHR